MKLKYRPGPKIHSLITPKGWFRCWQLRMAQKAIDDGIIRMAIKIESEDKQS